MQIRAIYRLRSREFTRAISISPRWLEPYFQRSFARRKSGDKAGALADLDAAVAIDPKSAVAFFQRALLKREQGDRDGAIEDYGQSLKLDPDQVAAHNNRGFIRRERKELGLALDDFEEALEISPNSPNGHLGRGMILADTADKAGAIAEYTEVLRLNPNNGFAYSNRGNIKRSLGDLDGALADLNQAIQIDPSLVSAYTERGLTYEAKGDTQRARADFQTALSLPIKYETGPWANSTAKSRLAALSAAQKKYDPGASDTEIKIGNTMPYSGPASAYGEHRPGRSRLFPEDQCRRRHQRPQDQLHQLDDGYSPPKTVEQTRKLVESDEVLLVFSSLGTPPNTAIQQYLNAKKVPQLFVATGASKWNDPEELSVDNGLAAQLPGRGRIYAKYMLTNKPNAKIARALPERRLRQGLPQRPEGRAGRQGRQDDRRRTSLPDHRRRRWTRRSSS